MPGKHYYFIVTILLFRVKSLCQNKSVVLVCTHRGRVLKWYLNVVVKNLVVVNICMNAIKY